MPIISKCHDSIQNAMDSIDPEKDTAIGESSSKSNGHFVRNFSIFVKMVVTTYYNSKCFEH